MSKQIQKHLAEQINCSDKLRENCANSKVILNTNVNQFGKIIDVSAANYLSPTCDGVVLDAFKRK